MPASHGSYRSLASLPAVMFVTSLATFVQSFVVVKLFFLVLFLLASIGDVALRKTVVVYPRIVSFYLSISVVGIVWAIVGISNGNDVVAVTDALRLYVIWSIAFIALYSLLRSQPSLGLIHAAMVAAGILISVINLVGLSDQIGGWGLIPDNIRQELELNIGIHEGYIQITSNNIGALFLIVPYLLSLQFRADARKANSALTKLSLVLCLALVPMSGRRGLWLVVALTPCTIFLLSIVTKSHGLVPAGARRLLAVYCVAVVLVLGTMSVLPERIHELGYVRYLEAAFSAEDARTIQKDYLLEAFAESPVLGSGFGGYAGYLRNEQRPWSYELTYHKLLFNMGIVGTTILGALFSVYLVLVIRLLRRFSDGSAIPFGLLTAFCSLLFGAYSNPYLGSFDLLFFIGLLPYLSTFRLGFKLLPDGVVTFPPVAVTQPHLRRIGRHPNHRTDERTMDMLSASRGATK